MPWLTLRPVNKGGRVMGKGWFETIGEFRKRMNRETNANTIRNHGRQHWGRGLESQEDYDSAAQLEADEIRSEKRSGSPPIRQAFESAEQYRRRMRAESEGIAPDHVEDLKEAASEISDLVIGERTSKASGTKSGISLSGVGIFFFWAILIYNFGPSSCKQTTTATKTQQQSPVQVVQQASQQSALTPHAEDAPAAAGQVGKQGAVDNGQSSIASPPVDADSPNRSASGSPVDSKRETSEIVNLGQARNIRMNYKIGDRVQFLNGFDFQVIQSGDSPRRGAVELQSVGAQTSVVGRTAPGLGACVSQKYNGKDIILQDFPNGQQWFCVKTEDGHWAEMEYVGMMGDGQGVDLILFVWNNTF